MTTYPEIIDRLDRCRTLEDLQDYAEWLYASDALDESEQTTTIGHRGPLAPWSVPQDAEVLDDRGDDVIVLLPSGEVARWRNTERRWEETSYPRASYIDEDGDCIECGHPADGSSGHGAGWCDSPAHQR